MITVLIPFYNPGKYLKEAVESVFNQTFQDWKLVLVNDASTDKSELSIKEYLRDPRVTLIRNNTNLGQSKTQNAGLNIIDTPYILMLDSDDWFFPYTIEVLLNEAEKVSADVALICGNLTKVFEDKDGNIIKKQEMLGGKTFDDHYEFLLANYIPYPRLYRTSALKSVGGWPIDDPYEGRYLEDRRMDVLLIEKYKIHWVNQMLYNYRKHTSNATVKHKRILNKMISWNIHYALKRWGNKYKPKFKRDSDGWKRLVKLKSKHIRGIDS
jgi:glycosyltransferase involved in cell wall biosynthesis